MVSGMVSSMTTSTSEKVRENRLRRMAERQGLRLVKSRRRDPRAIDYGTYRLMAGPDPVPETNGLDLEAIERWLRGER
jgi:hypothetical protein